jgi:hypothetical protein
VSGVSGGCSTHQPSSQSEIYAPDTHARIRVYFGVSTRFYFNTACEPRNGSFGYGASGGVAVAKPRMFYLANTTIGMPVPEDAYRYYDEYVIKANQPLTIMLDTGGWSQNGGFVTTRARRHATGTFVPVPGADYEAFADGENGGLGLVVRRLRVDDGRVQTEQMTVQGAPLCP